MSDTTTYLFYLLLVTFGVNFLLRAFPFLAFGHGGKPPAIIHYIGQVVSPAAIAMLVVYCFCVYFTARPFAAEYGWWTPELGAGILVVVLQLWRRNPLLSIVAGVILYMVLVQQVFPEKPRPETGDKIDLLQKQDILSPVKTSDN